jgi:hypothetical protein
LGIVRLFFGSFVAGFLTTVDFLAFTVVFAFCSVTFLAFFCEFRKSHLCRLKPLELARSK